MSDRRAQLQLTLGDGYTLAQELGGGGMSRVFVARENALGRDVVVKVLAPELSASVSAERFTREIATAARLQQANIVPVLAAETSGGVPYYTMPFVTGESLRAQMTSGTPLSMHDRVAVLRDVARALAYAHAQGVIHRDIKPENILLSGGAAVVTDFGIAKAISAARTLDGQSMAASDGTLTQVGSSIGTPAYMAPEQAVGEAIDARADLCAWGVVAYELLAGAHPFPGKSGASQLIAAHIAEVPRSLVDATPTLPREVSALVMQCLEKNPAQRRIDANEVLARLSNVTTPGDERPSSSAPRAGHKLAFGIGAGVAVIALVAAGTWFATRKPLGTTTLETQTVVVLPFDNLGAAEDAYFADGMTEEIAGRLARIPGLSVIARTSVLRFLGSNKSPQEIARELGADLALSGSIRWARIAGASGRGANDSTMVRIVPSLIRVNTGAQVSGEPLQQRLTDVFKVQADVAERVADALKLTLGAADLAAVRRPESLNADARNAQLLGRYLLQQRGLGNLKRAVESFERAIALDSSCARAWVGSAEAVDYLPTYGDSMSRAQSTRLAEQAALRAIALDSMQSDTHVALATVYEHAQRFGDGLVAVDRAIQLDPGNAIAWKERGVLLLSLGRVAEAEAPLRRALALEPLNAIALAELANWYTATGQVDSAVIVTKRILTIDAANPLFHWIAYNLLGANGRFAEARSECIAQPNPEQACERLWGDVRGYRNSQAALAVLDTMNTRGQTVEFITPAFQAVLYAQLGAADSAFARLRIAVRSKDGVLYGAVNAPAFAPMRQDARWAALMQEYRGR